MTEHASCSAHDILNSHYLSEIAASVLATSLRHIFVVVIIKIISSFSHIFGCNFSPEPLKEKSA